MFVPHLLQYTETQEAETEHFYRRLKIGINMGALKQIMKLVTDHLCWVSVLGALFLF